jgi:hypothetical protein
MKRKLKVGDLVEITALDHTTHDGPWGRAEDLVKSATPDHLKIVGYYIGTDCKCIQLAMGWGENGSYTTKWMIPKSTITSIVWLKKK